MQPSRRRSLALVLVAASTAASLGAVAVARSLPTTSPLDHPGFDRYDLAGGCYAIRSVGNGKLIARAGEGFAATAGSNATAEPVHMQAFDLGKYLLFAGQQDFVSGEQSPVADGVRPVTERPRGVVAGTYDENIDPAREPALGALDSAVEAVDPVTTTAVPAGRAVVAAAAPSAAAEWVVRQDDTGRFTLHIAVDDHEPANPGPLDPTIARTLTVAQDGTLTLVDGTVGGAPAQFTFEPAERACAGWPEIGLNITAPGSAAQKTSFEATTGYVDGHLHMMAFEFLGGMARCGRPWHPYGVTYALVDCPDHEPGGYGAILEQMVSGHEGQGHDTAGYPEFTYWPRNDSLTHEQVYYRWLERAWRGGLRMFTNLLVDNGVLCEIYPYKRNSCNEMDGVRLQAQRLHELERFIDAQSGGPGEGWFRIVTDPFQARRVINDGKLAVVMGIEVSVPFDCGEYLDVARCTEADIKARLDEVYALGVRQMELTNKFDNALTGVTGDSGSFGVVVNQGNKYETGQYWAMKSCTEAEGHGEHDHRHDKTQENLVDKDPSGQGRDSIFGAVLELSGGSGAAPVYPGGPHCSAQGLSDLGKAAIDGLIERGMIFDPDHMSASARKASLEHLRTRDYSGVISSHSWADDPTYREILALGGVITPHAGGAPGFVQDDWKNLRQWADPRYTFGLGFGSDVNGFSKQAYPHDGDVYGADGTFVGFGGTVFERQKSGNRTFDLNKDGLSHYGLYADWVEDARVAAGAEGDAFMADFGRATEAYLQMWERAIGVRKDSCKFVALTKAEAKKIGRGMSPEHVVRTVGQPSSRVGSTFTYCSQAGPVTVTFRNEKVHSVSIG
jgi:microsomal dipeptidase-like Zn-dependent dipeptidase